jgi:hypothetical protein
LVIIGPITNPRNIANERTVQIRQDQATPIPCEGCPVICHGLVSQPLLNVELGDVTTYRHVGSEFQIQVLFGKNLKSVWVNHENLQIVFELQKRAMTRLNPNNLPWMGEDFILEQKMLIEAGLCSDLL